MYAAHDGKYAPCCIAKRTVASDPRVYWHGEEMRQLRTQLSNGEWPKACSMCMLNRESGLQAEADYWNDCYKKINVEINIDSGNPTSGPIYLDYRPGNECNLKCRMCTPRNSSQIEKELDENVELREWLTAVTESDSNYDSLIDYVDVVQIEHLKVLGGEPTLDKKVFSFLSYIASTRNNRPSLHITTNATNLNKKFQELLVKFSKNLKLVFSVDAVGPTYEYIRTNAKWDIVSGIIEDTLEKNIARVYFINIVLTPYNMYNIPELLDWIRGLTLKGYRINIFAMASTKAYNGLSAILPEDIEEYISRVEEWIQKNGDSINGVSQIPLILKAAKFNKPTYERFKKYNNALDQIRETKLTDIDERFSKYV
jgi:molybdenum cofactor biosynthesis enzyme MoaA